MTMRLLLLVAVYLIFGVLLTFGRLWVLRRWGVTLLMSGIAWFFCVLMWPADLIISVYRFFRIREERRVTKRNT